MQKPVGEGSTACGDPWGGVYGVQKPVGEGLRHAGALSGSVSACVFVAGSLLLGAGCSSDSAAPAADAGATGDAATRLAVPSSYTDELCHFGYYEPLGNPTVVSRFDPVRFARVTEGILAYSGGGGLCNPTTDRAGCLGKAEALDEQLRRSTLREYLAASDATNFVAGSTGAEYLEILKPLTSLHEAALVLRPTYKVACAPFAGAEADNRSAGGPTATGFELIAFSGCDGGGPIRANRIAVTTEGKVTVLESAPAADCGDAW
ncbi:hypothetical protein OUZ56_032522 [Daphnia magna]|uniref:Uncharacterized protein n=1 Tax=Daphnia magna TaxID=35525 RepID=A0ABR0B949_9CRUS|nr:hypothetical protein OUZ56_032522 [Daphnia magna]